jgi:hypothetical protein
LRFRGVGRAAAFDHNPVGYPRWVIAPSGRRPDGFAMKMSGENPMPDY